MIKSLIVKLLGGFSHLVLQSTLMLNNFNRNFQFYFIDGIFRLIFLRIDVENRFFFNFSGQILLLFAGSKSEKKALLCHGKKSSDFFYSILVAEWNFWGFMRKSVANWDYFGVTKLFINLQSYLAAWAINLLQVCIASIKLLPYMR